MEYEKNLKDALDKVSSSNFQETVESTQTSNKNKRNDENLGRMEDFFKFLEIKDDKQLRKSIEETSLNTSQLF